MGYIVNLKVQLDTPIPNIRHDIPEYGELKGKSLGSKTVKSCPNSPKQIVNKPRSFFTLYP